MARDQTDRGVGSVPILQVVTPPGAHAVDNVLRGRPRAVANVFDAAKHPCSLQHWVDNGGPVCKPLRALHAAGIIKRMAASWRNQAVRASITLVQ